ncbi:MULTISPECIES: type II toxin-antitoxin system VapC family toxin [Protofrankia]|uniref:PilT protein domain protein n=1 Tax=Candidatus Protofrankia datiscae TaxID=2716812 RepID=F8B3M2_9ACTN|nr:MULTISPECIES: type II toxin-antitoxin system VapC family toxin [Protofrankia]AEH07859.1 PilT protein domain protein [Candidatus Protofrankia datiscae]
MSFLLDTNVVSEIRKVRPDRGVAAWVGSVDAERLYLSVLTVGEIEQGIGQLRQRGDTRQAALYANWLVDVVEAFGGRIVPVSVEAAREWGRARGSGQAAPVDALIGATARTHGWMLVTRNVKDFTQLDVPVFNPFAGET